MTLLLKNKSNNNGAKIANVYVFVGKMKTIINKKYAEAGNVMQTTKPGDYLMALTALNKLSTFNVDVFEMFDNTSNW